MKGQVRTSPPQFLENELVIPSLDGYGRLQTTGSISGGEITVANIPEPLDAGGGQLVVPVAVMVGEVDARQSGSWSVAINNFPADPASGTNQTTANSHLSEIEAAIESISSRIPAALSGGAFVTFEQNSNLIFADTTAIKNSTASIDSKTLDKVSSSPTNYNVTPTASTTPLASLACRAVLLVADDANTGTILVGGSSVSAASNIGTPLTAGDSRHYAPISNANLIYHASTASGQILHVEVIS